MMAITIGQRTYSSLPMNLLTNSLLQTRQVMNDLNLHLQFEMALLFPESIEMLALITAVLFTYSECHVNIQTYSPTEME